MLCNMLRCALPLLGLLLRPPLPVQHREPDRTLIGKCTACMVLQVEIGRYDLNANDGEVRTATEIIVHPNYDSSTTANDIALLHFDDPSTKTPIALPEQAGEWHSTCRGATSTALRRGAACWERTSGS